MNKSTIFKQTPGKLQRNGDTFAVVPSSTLEKVRNPISLAILIYLLDRPNDWVVRRADIMKRFGIGRDRYDAATKELRDLGLYWNEQVRNPAGKIIENKIFVSATPVKPECRKTDNPDSRQPVSARKSDLPDCGKNHNPENPHCGKSHQPEKPHCGKTDHLHNTELLHKTDNLHSSEPGGSAAAAAKPVDNSRLSRAEEFYDSPDDMNLFTVGVSVFAKYRIEEDRARGIIGQLIGAHGKRATIDAMTELVCRTPLGDPVAWLKKILNTPRHEMPLDWEPSPGAVSQLERMGIPYAVINNSRAYFKTWNLDRETTSNNFDEWFVEWCIRDFEDAECDPGIQAAWYGHAAAQEFREPAGGTIG